MLVTQRNVREQRGEEKMGRAIGWKTLFFFFYLLQVVVEGQVLCLLPVAVFPPLSGCCSVRPPAVKTTRDFESDRKEEIEIGHWRLLG